MKTSFFRDAVIILSTTLALCVLLEGVIRLLIPQGARTTFINGAPLGIEDGQLGHVNRPNARAKLETPEFSVEYEINHDGFRDKSMHANARQPGVKRILLVGDSFTFGAANAYEDIWPVIFSDKLSEQGRPAEVINAGVPGYDTRKEVLYLERLYSKYEPDVVVLTFLPHDLFSNAPANSRQAPLDFAARSSRKPPMRSHLLILFKRILRASDFFYSRLYLLTRRAQSFMAPLNARLTQQIEVTKKLFLQAKTFCENRGAKFVVLSIPQLFQVLVKAHGYDLENVDVDFIDKEFHAFSKENGFLWIPLLPEFVQEYRRSEADFYFRFDGHLTPAGNRLVGEYFSEKFVGAVEGQFAD